MYLQKLREAQVSCTNWPTDSTLPPSELDRLFYIVDAVLNSDAEAHEMFEVAKKEGISPKAMLAMGEMVKQALRQQEGQVMPDTYPLEILTYALLREWLDVARAEAADA